MEVKTRWKRRGEGRAEEEMRVKLRREKIGLAHVSLPRESCLCPISSVHLPPPPPPLLSAERSCLSGSCRGGPESSHVDTAASNATAVVLSSPLTSPHLPAHLTSPPGASWWEARLLLLLLLLLLGTYRRGEPRLSCSPPPDIL